jgi:hypothetical protein
VAVHGVGREARQIFLHVAPRRHEDGHYDDVRGTLFDQAGDAFVEGRPHQFEEARFDQRTRIARLDRVANAVEGLRPFRVAGTMTVEKDGFHWCETAKWAAGDIERSEPIGNPPRGGRRGAGRTCSPMAKQGCESFMICAGVSKSWAFFDLVMDVAAAGLPNE